MKVVYIADRGFEGGATKSLVELVSTMKNEHGVEPVVLTSGNNKLNEQLNVAGIENYPVGHGSFLQGAPDAMWKAPVKYVLFGMYYYMNYCSSIKKAVEIIDWSTVDLIHTNSARDDIGMELSERFNIPNICHIREFAELDFNCWSYRHKYVEYLAKKTNGFIAISNAVKNYWVKKGIPETKIDVVYNGVDAEKIKSADRTAWRNDKILKLVIVGGVIPNKGQWQAIEAICMLPVEIRKNLHLDVIGNITETYQKKLEQPLHKTGAMDCVSFVGGCDDVYDRLKDYHIGLMCSKAEGFGRVTAEYMHAGLGVIASACGANTELIDNGVTGLLYNRESTETLAEAIEKLYNNRELLCNIGEAGQAYARVNFTKELNSNNIYKIYERYAGKKAPVLVYPDRRAEWESNVDLLRNLRKTVYLLL